MNWSYQKSKLLGIHLEKKMKPWLIYQHINKKKLAKTVILLQEFVITQL